MKDVNGEVCVKDMSNVIGQLNRCRLKIFYAELCGPELFLFFGFRSVLAQNENELCWYPLDMGCLIGPGNHSSRRVYNSQEVGKKRLFSLKRGAAVAH